MTHLRGRALIILIKGLAHLLRVPLLHPSRHCPRVRLHLLRHHVVIIIVVVVVVVDLYVVRSRIRRYDSSARSLLRNVATLTAPLLSFINSNYSDLGKCLASYTSDIWVEVYQLLISNSRNIYFCSEIPFYILTMGLFYYILIDSQANLYHLY